MTVSPQSDYGQVFELASVNGHQDTDTTPMPTGLTPWEQRIFEAKATANGDPVAESDALMQLCEERALEIINSDRPIRQQKVAIKAVAKSLGFNPDNNFVADLFDQLDNTIAAYEPDVEPGGTFIAQGQAWLLDRIFLIGLNLLVGMPGAGKSRLLVALIRAYLSNQPTFIQRQLIPGSGLHFLLVGTDQDRQQWGALLAESGWPRNLTRQGDGPPSSPTSFTRIHLKPPVVDFARCRWDALDCKWCQSTRKPLSSTAFLPSSSRHQEAMRAAAASCVRSKSHARATPASSPTTPKKVRPQPVNLGSIPVQVMAPLIALSPASLASATRPTKKPASKSSTKTPRDACSPVRNEAQKTSD